MPVEIFCCYARKDQLHLNKLISYLTPLKQQELINVWADSNIGAGSEWEEEIKKHLNTAQIILLFISPDFMVSNYCYGIEMKRALERHERGEAKVIPILLRHIYWQGSPIGKLQALPTNGKPITHPSWQKQEIALFNVAEGIRMVVEEMLLSQVAGHQTISAEETPPTSPSPGMNLSNNDVSQVQKVNEESEGKQENTLPEKVTEQQRDDEDRKPEAPIPPPDILRKPVHNVPLDRSLSSPSFLISKKIKLAIIALVVVLVAVAGSGLFYLLESKIPKSLSKTPTTQTPVLTITLTSSQGTKLVSATPNILLTAEASNPIYYDVLTSSSTHKASWQSVGTNNSPCVFASDGYHVRINPSTNPEAICHEVPTSYQDFAISVDMVLDRGSGGLIFRDQDVLRGNGAYLFEISTGGEYIISTVTQNRVIKNWTFSSAIHKGNKVRNTLQVVASQHLLFFYINGTYLTEIIDGTFSDGGISFACFGSGEAIFSNLYVYPYH